MEEQIIQITAEELVQADDEFLFNHEIYQNEKWVWVCTIVRHTTDGFDYTINGLNYRKQDIVTLRKEPV